MQIPEGVTNVSTILENGCKRFTFSVPCTTSEQVPEEPCVGTFRRADKGKGKELVYGQPTIPMPEPTIIVEMFFLCNLQDLEVDANADFVAFQKECPMQFERMDRRGTGTHYSGWTKHMPVLMLFYSQLESTPIGPTDVLQASLHTLALENL